MEQPFWHGAVSRAGLALSHRYIESGQRMSANSLFFHSHLVPSLPSWQRATETSLVFSRLLFTQLFQLTKRLVIHELFSSSLPSSNQLPISRGAAERTNLRWLTVAATAVGRESPTAAYGTGTAACRLIWFNSRVLDVAIRCLASVYAVSYQL